MNRSEELIECLEGEIVKRDARIAELEAAKLRLEDGMPRVLEDFYQCRQERDQLRAELAAIKDKPVQALSELLLAQLITSGAINYQEQTYGITFDDGSAPMDVVVTLQHPDKPTAHQLRMTAEAELAALREQVPVGRLPACPSRAFAVANLRDLAQSLLQHDPDVGIFRDENQAFLINELADLTESFSGDVTLYAAQVDKQVVMPDRMDVPGQLWSDTRQPYGRPLNFVEIAESKMFNMALDEVARLNAAAPAPGDCQ